MGPLGLCQELLRPGRCLCLGLRDRLLAVGDRGSLLRELGCRDGAFVVGRLQLVHLQRNGLLALRDSDGRRVDLGAQALELGVAIVEFREPLVDLTLVLAQNLFALVERRSAAFEVRQASADLVLELDLARRCVQLLAE